MLDNASQNRGRIDEAVARTLSFFDTFDHPVDLLELWRFLPLPCSLAEVQDSLAHWRSRGLVEEGEGAFFLAGRSDILRERRDRYNFSRRKLKRAKAVSRLFQVFPGVRLIFVSNLIGPYNLRDGSDIDFFIVCRPGLLWLSRLWCAGLMKILNLRPTKNDKRDKVCLSFYVSSANQDMERFALPEEDRYFQYWLLGLYLISGREAEYQNFLASNHWLSGIFPNFYPGSFMSGVAAKAPGVLVRFLEDQAKALQFRFMSTYLKQAALQKQAIIADDVLKLFLQDKRPLFNQRAKERCLQHFGL